MRKNFKNITQPTLLSTLLQQEEEHISFPCGGAGTCKKCRVIVKGNTSPVTDTEKMIFTESEIADGVRLACQTYITGDATIDYNNKEKKFQKKGRIASDSLHICLKTFQSAEEVETTNYLTHKINLASFWFFNLYVSGVRVKYQTVPVLPQIQSPYSNIDSFLSCQIENFDRIFTQ